MIEYLAYIRAAGASHTAAVAKRKAEFAQIDAASAKSTAGSTANDVGYLEQRLGAIELAVETLARLGISSGMFSEQDFLRVAQEVDLEDGVLDGRRDLNKMRKICVQCERPNTSIRANCMWCGESLAAVKSEKTQF